VNLAQANFLDQLLNTLSEYDARAFTYATVAHELHHVIQIGLDQADSLAWYYEATAVWMEIASFGDDVGAIDSVFDTFYLPEICLGKTVRRIVLGEHHPSGRLPITVGPFAYGSGLDYIQPERFAYGE
jgi:hypothetical protein